ncbi:amidohydrolase [Pontibacillus halophilus JSM 076056 = DSM 19796]|uniref:Amidohydrolase n=1 Tax=Pontibacillus halophilus JSM 076056 = DSM 19796 TaxID=1385510 RepID=A0A0A5HYF4_9BACI|nr:M20 peptidase aminoacylase family protein [Pontibacillus halophilus]KGX88652.1 amidohydrolase [Pontibacillus halophilus JSM 076056 = DSM 19796]
MADHLSQRVQNTFHYLHEHGEISWEEVETTSYIASLLRESGCEVIQFEDCTGVVGKYGNFNSDLPVVGIRADIDALWQEVNGTFQPNHSCGHDAHMSMVLGLLWKIEQQQELKDEIALKFIFQPAEEKGSGALKMVEKGVVDDVDYLYGIHLRPGQETKMGQATPVIIHGAAKMYHVEIRGHDAHGARPHQNQNAIEIGAQIVSMINKIYLDPRIPHSVKMTHFQAGGKNANIIPGNGTFSLDLRAQTNEMMDLMESKVHGIFEAIRNLYEVDIEIVDTDGIAAAKRNQEAIDLMTRSIKEVLGEEGAEEPLVTPGGDDFHFYTIERPSLKATMLGLGCDLTPGLHHPHMTFNKEALMDGVNILYRAVLNTYNETRGQVPRPVGTRNLERE